MKIIDPLILPVLLFFGFGMIVVAFEESLTSFEYAVLVVLLLAITFGSIIFFQRRQSSDEK